MLHGSFCIFKAFEFVVDRSTGNVRQIKRAMPPFLATAPSLLLTT